jgi:two-component system KDP operon response regulator KdpE
MRVLVIDDDADFGNVLRLLLARDGHEMVAMRCDAQTALAAQRLHPDAILIDVDAMWRRNKDLFVALRQATAGPVVLMGGFEQSEEVGRLIGLGANGWIAKPVDYGTLLAHLSRSQVSGGCGGDDCYDDGQLLIVPQERYVELDGQIVDLTHIEFELLQHLLAHRGHVVPRVELVRLVWGDINRNRYQYLANYIGQLRLKLESDPAHPKYLRTRRGVGYWFQPSNATGDDVA